MIDQETNSLWAHMLGEAMRGPMTGTKLKSIPAVMTVWGRWKHDHPTTSALVMRRTAGIYFRDFLMPDGGLILGFNGRKGTRIWDLHDLNQHTIVNDVFEGRPMLIHFDRPSFSAFIYDRRVDDRTLEFERRNNKTVDKQTGSRWNLRTGRCLDGSLKGKRLRAMSGVISDAAHWSVFHPVNETQWRPRRNKSVRKTPR